MNVFIARVVTDKNTYQAGKKQQQTAVKWANKTAAQVAEFETIQEKTVESERTGIVTHLD